MAEKIVLFWYRRDLRVEDNTALFYALKSGQKVQPIFIFDPGILSKLDNIYDARVGFIYDQLNKLNHIFSASGGSLRVEIGDPFLIMQRLFAELHVAAIYTNRDYEPYAKARDEQVASLCKENGIEFLSFKDQVIFEAGEILTDQEQPYKVFTPFKNKWLRHFEQLKLSFYPSEHSLGEVVKGASYPFPSLEKVGFKKSNILIPPMTFDGQIISKYDEQRDYPAINGTSKLGIHLRHGTISVRHAVKVGSDQSATWLNELIWREFYMMILAHFPRVVDHAFKPKYDLIPWRQDEEGFDAWCTGTTGYPIVDAGMRELVETGYMHNRVRMVTSSFLTKHLLIDWRLGEAFFARHLLDFELSSNNGGWQWAAGTGTDAQPYFRVFNPTSQLEKFDRQKAYIKKWIPEYTTDEYAKPIVDHKLARNRAIETYKEALV